MFYKNVEKIIIIENLNKSNKLPVRKHSVVSPIYGKFKYERINKYHNLEVAPRVSRPRNYGSADFRNGPGGDSNGLRWDWAAHGRAIPQQQIAWLRQNITTEAIMLERGPLPGCKRSPPVRGEHLAGGRRADGTLLSNNFQITVFKIRLPRGTRAVPAGWTSVRLARPSLTT